MNWLNRLRRFLRKPWRAKVISARFRFKPLWNRLCPSIPLPVCLPYGGWWLAVNDVCSDAIFTGSFEEPEWRFVDHCLKEGMIVLDIGAHHGFYTILAAKKVGSSGRVIAFEPSPRERRRLLVHLRINRCNKVKIEPFALSSQQGKAAFFLVDGRDTGCNSLRPPAVSEPTKTITVSTTTLESYLEREGIQRVDLIKMDAEGAELEVLKGATRLLGDTLSPIILCEVDDSRTQPWGYSAHAIVEFLENYGYQWFGLNSKGQVVPGEQRESYNLVALPARGVADLLL